ncbi:MAG: DUF3152 domain-containing protein [Actinomycetota bacterium]
MGLREPLTRSKAAARRRRLARSFTVAVVVAVAATATVRAITKTSDVARPAAHRVVVPGQHVLPQHTIAPSTSPTSAPSSGRPVFAVAPGRTPASGPGPLRLFTVEVEDGTGIGPAELARAVESVLWDRRSWGGSGRVAFRRVASGGSLRVILATPATTRSLCRPLDTGRTLSCYQHGRAVLNLHRWENGSEYFPDLPDYRAYMINHEVGHALGHDHVGCPGPGRPAPVMLQQTKGLAGCTANGWPLPTERD